ncbi:MAG: type II toxin-antitoxin system HicB family antitoxin [Dehalococcoidia bacterium]
MKRRFTAVYERRGRWYVAYVEELPGADTQGKTLKEAKDNLKEALKLIMEANRELANRNQTGAQVLREPITVEA